MVELGDEVKDRVTGYQGIATSRHTYLQGCDRIGVQKKVGKDGKVPEAQIFDEPQLIIIKPKVNKRMKSDKPGGPVLFMPKDKTLGRK